MAAYTSGGDKLHMCYTFDFLGPNFSARFFRRKVEAFEAMVKDGWACWAFSNHDVIRHVSRWGAGRDRDQLARLAIAILLSLRGSVSLYQGEELGLSEAALRFEDLVDPYGITFWPEFKGRDGCRTPMVWEADAPNAGFSTARPWLPVPEEHLPWRSMWRAARRPPCWRTTGGFSPFAAPIRRFGPVRSVSSMHRRRFWPSCARSGSEEIACLFNLGKVDARVTAPALMTPLDGSGFATRPDADGRSVTLGPGEAFFGRLEAPAVV